MTGPGLNLGSGTLLIELGSPVASRYPSDDHRSQYGRSRRRSRSQERPENVVFDPPLFGHQVFYELVGHQLTQAEAYPQREKGFQTLLRLIVHVPPSVGWIHCFTLCSSDDEN